MGLPTLHCVANFCVKLTLLHFKERWGAGEFMFQLHRTLFSVVFMLCSKHGGWSPFPRFLGLSLFSIVLTVSGWDSTHTGPARSLAWEGEVAGPFQQHTGVLTSQTSPWTFALTRRWTGRCPPASRCFSSFSHGTSQGLSIGHNAGSFVSSYDRRLLASLWFLPWVISHQPWGSWETH